MGTEFVDRADRAVVVSKSDTAWSHAASPRAQTALMRLSWLIAHNARLRKGVRSAECSARGASELYSMAAKQNCCWIFANFRCFS